MSSFSSLLHKLNRFDTKAVMDLKVYDTAAYKKLAKELYKHQVKFGKFTLHDGHIKRVFKVGDQWHLLVRYIKYTKKGEQYRIGTLFIKTKKNLARLEGKDVYAVLSNGKEISFVDHSTGRETVVLGTIINR